MNDLQSQQSEVWNPFCPTKRDLKRTEQLAQKNSLVAGILAFLFPIAAMIYLNRGINSLKILGYALTIGIALSISAESEEKAFDIGRATGTITKIVIVVENINAIDRARKRQKTLEVRD